MNDWINYVNFSISGAALLLSVVGLWFTAVMPGIDRWSKRFFVSYFLIFIVNSFLIVVSRFLPAFISLPRHSRLLPHHIRSDCSRQLKRVITHEMRQTRKTGFDIPEHPLDKHLEK